MKVIETEYNGYKFRSRLEARWAVFFDELGIEYLYEPEGFVLEDGTKYLPDFYLPKIYRGKGKYGLWVEVKGVMTDYDENNIEKFEKAQNIPVYVVGEIPKVNEYYDIVEYYRHHMIRYKDESLTFAICPICNKVGIVSCGQWFAGNVCSKEHEFNATINEMGDIIATEKNTGEKVCQLGINSRKDIHKYILCEAFKKARQARFEQQENIKLKWEVLHLTNKQKPIIPDCLKSCFCGVKMNDRKD